MSLPIQHKFGKEIDFPTKTVALVFFDFGINDIDVALGIHKDIAGKKVPNLIGFVDEMSNFIFLFKPQSCHIGVNYYLVCGMGICHTRLYDDWLYGTAIESSKTMKAIGCIGENDVVHQNLAEKSHDAAAIEKVIDFVYDLFCHIGVVLVAAWTWDAEAEDIQHGNPKALFLGHSLSGLLFDIEGGYICSASSTLRFMYCAKSLELIGDCCDAAIFRFLRSVTSLWNGLR